MSKNRRSMQTRPDDRGGALAWIHDIVRQARLAWRLFWDRRVPLWTKVIPPATLAYLLIPTDIMPDLPLVILGQLDDVAVLMLGTKLFIDLAPPEIVREHLQALGARVEEWRVVEDEEQDPSSDVVSGTLEEPKEETEGR